MPPRRHLQLHQGRPPAWRQLQGEKRPQGRVLMEGVLLHHLMEAVPLHHQLDHRLVGSEPKLAKSAPNPRGPLLNLRMTSRTTRTARGPQEEPLTTKRTSQRPSQRGFGAFWYAKIRPCISARKCPLWRENRRWETPARRCAGSATSCPRRTVPLRTQQQCQRQESVPPWQVLE